MLTNSTGSSVARKPPSFSHFHCNTDTSLGCDLGLMTFRYSAASDFVPPPARPERQKRRFMKANWEVAGMKNHLNGRAGRTRKLCRSGRVPSQELLDVDLRRLQRIA